MSAEWNRSTDSRRMVACLDLEGVLIPEIWPCIADRTGIDALRATTREEPDYKRLVVKRMEALKADGIRLHALAGYVQELRPLPGAVDFVRALQSRFEVVIVSDAFLELVRSFLPWLGVSDVRCHAFRCNDAGYAVEARYVRTRGKHEVVEELGRQGKWTLAVGDAHNDLSMLRAADLGLLFRPSAATRAVALDLPAVTDYQEILDACQAI